MKDVSDELEEMVGAAMNPNTSSPETSEAVRKEYVVFDENLGELSCTVALLY